MEPFWYSHLCCVVYFFTFIHILNVSKQLLQVTLVNELHRCSMCMLSADSQEVVGFWISTDSLLSRELIKHDNGVHDISSDLSVDDILHTLQ
jgi:hypothetical protein